MNFRKSLIKNVRRSVAQISPRNVINKKKLVLSIILSIGLVGFGYIFSVEDVQANTEKPNIVVIYVDDVSPDMKRLWKKSSRTPALAKFVDNGIEFVNSTGVTPLCCPGNVGFQTGQYGHNNGVTKNEPRNYDPTNTIATRLKSQGYATMFGGKFLVGMNKYAPKRNDVFHYAQGWDYYDLIWKKKGNKYNKFYDYTLWTRSKNISYGTDPKDHSTYVVTNKMANHIRKAPSDKPIYAQLNLFSGHTPNIPMKRFKNHPKCKNVSHWKGDSYNEGNVSDKPKYIRKLPKLSGNAYNLRSRCEEMMTIDWATQKIRSALRDTGRLNNTLLVFTADNGWSMGEHRWDGKRAPYATPVPLFVLWPKELGGEKRKIIEPVQNIDIAPTFCEIAGCEVPNADGKSILPLIKGEVNRLDRLFVYEENLHKDYDKNMPAWYGLRTTKNYSTDSFWVYTEYKSGEKELYNLTKDPFQLKNLANDSRFDNREMGLRNLLHREVIEPDNVEYIE